jgi:hypothetical protein
VTILRRLALGALVLLFTAGCATQLRNRELERVAKDWSMVVRASQVIPVYPLTEDLQPGDIFLVQVPVDEQEKIYQERGFLPFDNLIHRLNPAGYASFYLKSFDAGGDRRPLPRSWLAPTDDALPWSASPRSTFPTYSFSVRSGGGFSLALPVHGVPVGLSLLGGDAADGAITIADAHTYGVDTLSLYQEVLAWALGERPFLSHFAPGGGRQNYLRVVSRVYLTGRLNVSLTAGRSVGAAASAGAVKPVDLTVPAAGADPKAATLEAYRTNLDTLNKMIDEALKKVTVRGAEVLVPGGSLKVIAASANSISLVETFPRPLVIGYLGFDMAILDQGVLGPPIPTHAVLEQRVRPPARVISLAQDTESTILEYFAVKSPVLRERIDACRRGKGLAHVERSDFIQDPRHAEERRACVGEIFGTAPAPRPASPSGPGR